MSLCIWTLAHVHMVHSEGDEADLGLVLWWLDLFAEAVPQFTLQGSLLNQSVFPVTLHCVFVMMELIHFFRWRVFLCLALVTVVAHLSSCIYSEQTEAAENINHFHYKLILSKETRLLLHSDNKHARQNVLNIIESKFTLAEIS